MCLSDKWSPALQIRTVLLSIQALLSAPNPDDPLANDVAEQWKKNESSAIETGERRTKNTPKLRMLFLFEPDLDLKVSLQLDTKKISPAA